ncbi:MAG: cation transporter, partial [Flavobacteriales bacterium]|nr:cation transporter [Flavobacteriales bacterium]
MHDHNHDHIHHHHHSTDNIKMAFFLNLVFTIIEIFGGILTNSVAIVTDAVHDLGDTVTIGFSWYLEKISKKKRTKDF